MGKKIKAQDSAEEVETDDSNAETEDNASEAAADAGTEDTEAATAPKSSVQLVSETEANHTAAADSLDIHSRLTEAAADAGTGPQHIAGPLNRVEILMGSLKTALPDAIKAVSDQSLKDDLTLLLGLL